MKIKMHKYRILNQVFAMLLILLSSIQSLLANSGNAMIDVLYKNQKFYTVFAVLLIIFIGIVLWLVRLDRKLTKLERDMKS